MVPIVIVDDVQEDLLLAQRVLRQCSILNPTKLLKSGDECLAYFAGKPPFQDRVLPCILLLDLIMTPLPGLTVLRTLTEQGHAERSVIVMLSGLTDLKQINQGYQLGARTFIVKPFGCEDILEIFRNLKGVDVQEGINGHVLHLQE